MELSAAPSGQKVRLHYNPELGIVYVVYHILLVHYLLVN